MNDSSAAPGSRAFAISGALAFAASIAYGVYAYGVLFTQPAASSIAPAGAWLTNAALFVAFGAHHSILARRPVKAVLRQRVPPAIERSLYVWIASVLFFLMMYGWQRFPGDVWRVEGPAAWLIHAGQLAGFGLGIAAGRRIDVRELAGLGSPPSAMSSSEPVRTGPYGLVRHPLYLAFLVLLWAVAVMTVTRLIFAVLFTAYVAIAIPLEERDLRGAFGESYRQYARVVRYRLVPGVY